MVRHVSSFVGIALLGAVVALVGAGSHRAFGWVSVVACLLMVGTASVFARAWRGFAGLLVLGSVWAALTMLFAQPGPGGSLLIPDDARSLAWVFGGALVIAASALVPRRLLGDAGEPA